jgi:hypothetical protein
MGHRWSAVHYAALSVGLMALPLYVEFQVADLTGRVATVILTALGLLFAYGVAVFLLRSLAGEYDRSPAKTDIRPPK